LFHIKLSTHIACRFFKLYPHWFHRLKWCSVVRCSCCVICHLWCCRPIKEFGTIGWHVSRVCVVPYDFVLKVFSSLITVDRTRLLTNWCNAVQLIIGVLYACKCACMVYFVNGNFCTEWGGAKVSKREFPMALIATYRFNCFFCNIILKMCSSNWFQVAVF